MGGYFCLSDKVWSNEGAREESLSGLNRSLAGQGLIISVTAYVGRAAAAKST